MTRKYCKEHADNTPGCEYQPRREQSEHTPTLFGYTIGLVNGAVDGRPNSWVLGKPGYSQLYYFDNQKAALQKLIELQGAEPIVRAVNAHEEWKLLLEALVYHPEQLGFKGIKEVCKKALAKAEGK